MKFVDLVCWTTLFSNPKCGKNWFTKKFTRGLVFILIAHSACQVYLWSDPKMVCEIKVKSTILWYSAKSIITTSQL